MKWKISDSEYCKKHVIPEVGQAWYHKGQPENIYIRVADITGEKCLSYFSSKDRFASIGENGVVAWTPKLDSTIVLLDMTFTHKKD